MSQASQIIPLLNVEDVERSAQFYRELLGFEITNDWKDAGRTKWAMLTSQGVRLMLNEAEHRTDGATRRARPDHADVVLYVTVESADDLHRTLLAGGHAPSEVRTESYGLRQFELRDPDGYELAITSPLAR
jgi:uncharacterized glyoxalase superfamily protein PhnB